MTHLQAEGEYCGQAYLEASKKIFQKFGEEISSYSEKAYDVARERGMDHKEALERMHNEIITSINSYNEAKHYIEEVCHQSTAGLDRASDLA
ncbi:MAG: hypothetical protein QXY90_04960, partial [Candidatus Anstonellales archaeon]